MTDNSFDSAASARLEAAERALMQGRLDRRTFTKIASAAGLSLAAIAQTVGFAQQARAQQDTNAANLAGQYDYIVVGAGSGGCVVAARLSENPAVNVLLLEEGGWDTAPSVSDPSVWFTNIGTPRSYVYPFHATHCNDRTIPLAMGRGIGGGSMINASVWARGHKENYQHWAHATGDAGWGYDSVLDIYRRIEDWQGPASPWRGKGGNVYVKQLDGVNPIAPAMVQATAALGVPASDDLNGATMESHGGVGIAQALVKDGQRHGVAKAYLYPALTRPNLTVLTGAEVTSLAFVGDRCTGVNFLYNGASKSIAAARETVLSAGTVGTPKLLMLSGIGPANELAAMGIKVRLNAPNVGKNVYDHILLGGCLWAYKQGLPPRNNAAECTFFWRSDFAREAPDIQPFQIEVPFATDTNAKAFPMAAAAWTIAPGLVQPRSHGTVKLASADHTQMAIVDPNYLAEPDDMRALKQAVALCREIGNSKEMAAYVDHEIMPGPLTGTALEDFIRNGAGTYYHLVGSCAMGAAHDAVTTPDLRVRGVRGLRIADASVMPSPTTGNTMAPSVIIGERAAALIMA